LPTRQLAVNIGADGREDANTSLVDVQHTKLGSIQLRILVPHHWMFKVHDVWDKPHRRRKRERKGTLLRRA